MNSKLLYVWVGAYSALWTLTTIILDPAVPYDAVEALNWAQNSEWGSPKNPWLVGMVWRPALLLPGAFFSAYWYITHFFAVALGMAGTWHLARLLSGSEQLAWVALLTLNLSGVINFDIISYNDNYLLVMLWPWMFVFFYRAVSQNSAWWIAFALTAGLASMAKYSTFLLIGALLLTTVYFPSVRRCYRQPFFLFSLVIILIIISPNLHWLWKHDFAAIHWVESQIKRQFNPLLPLKLLSIFYPLFFLVWIIRHNRITLCWPSADASKAVLVAGCLPMLPVTLWFLFHHGGRLTEWLQPFFIIAPALVTGCTCFNSCKSLRKANNLLAVVSLLVLLGYITVMTANLGNAGKKMSGIAAFSQNAEMLWKQRYGTPLRLVGGEHLAEWLLFYAPSSPRIITPWNADFQPNIYNKNITLSDITTAGALLIGRSDDICTRESFHRALGHWPELRLDATEKLTYRDNGTHPGKEICMGFVKPSFNAFTAHPVYTHVKPLSAESAYSYKPVPPFPF